MMLVFQKLCMNGNLLQKVVEVDNQRVGNSIHHTLRNPDIRAEDAEDTDRWRAS